MSFEPLPAKLREPSSSYDEECSEDSCGDEVDMDSEDEEDILIAQELHAVFSDNEEDEDDEMDWDLEMDLDPETDLNPDVQELLMNNFKSSQPMAPHHEAATSDDWMSSFFEWSCKKREKESKKQQENPSTDKHTIFQSLFLDGVSLKLEVVEAITRLEGVLSVGWGFSDEKGQTMPVIRITTKQDCDTQPLLNQIATTLCDKVFEKRLSREEIQAYLRVAKSDEQIIQNFESPGNEFRTTYDQNYSTPGTFTGYIHAQMELRLESERNHRIDKFYPFVPLHCVLPAKSRTFQKNMVKNEILAALNCPHVKQLTNNTFIPNSQVPELQHIHDQFQMPAMLRTALYPQKTKSIMRAMENHCHLKYTVDSTQHLPGYLAGTAGLIEHDKTNDKTYTCIVNIPEYSVSNNYPSFFTHPCNMDIAVLKPLSLDDANVKSYSDIIERQVPGSFLLQGPAREIKNLDGKVIAINRGTAIKLSPCVYLYEFWINDQRFPCIQWTVDKDKDEQLRQIIVSGSPVFVQSSFSNSFTFIGGMYSTKTAFSSDFALELIRPDIIEHLIEDILQCADMIDKQQILSRLKEIAKHCKTEGITSWDEEIPIESLGIHQQGSVLCCLDYYTHSLPKNN